MGSFLAFSLTHSFAIPNLDLWYCGPCKELRKKPSRLPLLLKISLDWIDNCRILCFLCVHAFVYDSTVFLQPFFPNYEPIPVLE
jgi:hypothetical protein